MRVSERACVAPLSGPRGSDDDAKRRATKRNDAPKDGWCGPATPDITGMYRWLMVPHTVSSARITLPRNIKKHQETRCDVLSNNVVKTQLDHSMVESG